MGIPSTVLRTALLLLRQRPCRRIARHGRYQQFQLAVTQTFDRLNNDVNCNLYVAAAHAPGTAYARIEVDGAGDKQGVCY